MLVCLALTAALGVAFLIVKGFEYKEDIEKNLVRVAASRCRPRRPAFLVALLDRHGGARHSSSIGIVAWPPHHHVARRKLPLRSPQYEVTALYWHLVDIIWIVLYPLIYLGGRAE